jgi:integrase
MHFLTAAQVEQLATVIAPPFGLLVRFDAYTGLRAGELAALRVGRLDLLRGACEVVESATEVANELVWGATNGLPAALRVHDLRHTCASLLIREGASIKAVQHHLGHKSASITLDRYGHLFPEELDHLADRLDRLHAEVAVYPACTDAPVAALGQGKGPGR